jgi:hypothetical protein
MRNKISKSIILLAAICAVFLADCYCQETSIGAENQLSTEELKEGWVLLFDGRTSSGWRGVNKAEFPEAGWEIKDGVLTVLGKKGGDILTDRKYGDFDLKIEFKVKEQEANSGVKYYVFERENKKGQALGLEFQTSNSHPGTHLETALGSVYDILPAKEKHVHPAPSGEWNQVRIVSKDKRVQHWLNGKKILQYRRGGKKFRKGVASSKFNNIENFGEADEGFILLQDHGDEVSFRNIKIREL